MMAGGSSGRFGSPPTNRSVQSPRTQPRTSGAAARSLTRSWESSKSAACNRWRIDSGKEAATTRCTAGDSSWRARTSQLE